ncbi:GTP-binding protein [Pseudoalteromonas ardens]|uniref:Cobalamin biosynthesis protein CobW n=1 Tax=Pseudoalteromonas rubra TaxID=43658 RepID=A0A0L0ENG2_9GAMM|nr:GTP-binding protein [Pseudoalteromonas sp. R96]KNC65941.1 cobalamin biosynthesis protein CobW [Pseudoalteromonas rubra]MDK1312044.1 GTP-binding protein [Pseudoalteromonas sp. R96]
MEPILVLVGFLGAGKTTLLKRLLLEAQQADWDPYVILNDYEHAELDARQLAEQLSEGALKPLDGSCICCSGITALRDSINRIPQRKRGITLIEANGTSDACRLMGFLGVGLDERFKPPVQIAVVDAKNWQRRGEHNALEANQVQVSSLIVLTHTTGLSDARIQTVKDELHQVNPNATIQDVSELALWQLPELSPVSGNVDAFEHQKSHWASCSVALPALPDETCIGALCARIPETILRVKGCTRIGTSADYTYFERCPDGAVSIRPFKGEPVTGSKLLVVGPGSDPGKLNELVSQVLAAH